MQNDVIVTISWALLHTHLAPPPPPGTQNDVIVTLSWALLHTHLATPPASICTKWMAP